MVIRLDFIFALFPLYLFLIAKVKKGLLDFSWPAEPHNNVHDLCVFSFTRALLRLYHQLDIVVYLPQIYFFLFFILQFAIFFISRKYRYFMHISLSKRSVWCVCYWKILINNGAPSSRIATDQQVCSFTCAAGRTAEQYASPIQNFQKFLRSIALELVYFCAAFCQKASVFIILCDVMRMKLNYASSNYRMEFLQHFFMIILGISFCHFNKADKYTYTVNGFSYKVNCNYFAEKNLIVQGTK